MDGEMLARFEQSVGDAFSALHAVPTAPMSGSSACTPAMAPDTAGASCSSAAGAVCTAPANGDASPLPMADGDQGAEEGETQVDGVQQCEETCARAAASASPSRPLSPPSLAGPAAPG